jgi:hypothetical protein
MVVQSSLLIRLHRQPLTSNGLRRGRLRFTCKVPRCLPKVVHRRASSSMPRAALLRANHNIPRAAQRRSHSSILRVALHPSPNNIPLETNSLPA